MMIALETILFGPVIEDLEAVLDVVAGLGFEGVEFAQRPEMLKVKRQDSCAAVSYTELAQMLEMRELTLLGFAGGTLPERIEFCGKATSSQRVWPRYLYTDNVSSELIKLAEDNGHQLALHPHAFISNHRLSDARAALERWPELLWLPDIAHLSIFGDKISEALTIDSPARFAAVHLKDWDAAYGRSYHRYAKGFTALGTGDVRVDTALAQLKRLKYQGWLVVEQDYPRAGLLNSLVQSVKYLESQGITLRAKDELFSNGWERLTREPSRKASDLPTLDRIHPSADLHSRFSAFLARKASDSLQAHTDVHHMLQHIYGTIAEALKELCDCCNVTVWACGGTPQDDISLIANTSDDASIPTVLSRRNTSLGEAIGRLSSQPIELAHVQSTDINEMRLVHEAQKLGAGLMIGFPILNRYNSHHVRLFICLLPRENWLAKGTDPPTWYSELPGLGCEIAGLADAVLDDLCSYTAAKVNILAGKHSTAKSFLAALIELIQKQIGCEGVTIFLVNQTHDRMTLGASSGLEWSVPPAEQYYPKSTSTWTSRAWIRNEPILLRDAQSEFKHAPRSREDGPGVDPERDNLMLVPMVDSHSRVIGVVRCRNKSELSAEMVNVEAFVDHGLTAPASMEVVFTDDDAAIMDVICHATVPHLQVLQSNEHRAQAVARMTHELSMPLVAVRGCIAWLKDDLDGMPEDCAAALTYDYPGDIDAWSSLMLGLLRNAEFQGTRLKHLDIHPKRIKFLADVIAPAVRQIGEFAKDRDFDPRRISYSEITEIPAVYVDKHRFQQVVFNLLSNSIKYAYNDPSKFLVKIVGERRIDGFVLHFKDWGPGIPKDHENIIFEENVRGPTAVNDYVAGQGIGLWIVRRIVEAHGGSVKVTGNWRPTVVTVFLPQSLASGPPRTRKRIKTPTEIERD